MNEVRILASVKHPNIVAYKEAFFEEGMLHIVMENASGGDLYSKIRKRKETDRDFTEEEVW